MSAIETSERDDVLIITVDDGKVNALSSGLVSELQRALDAAEKGAAPVLVLKGREGTLSAGFDLGELGSGRAQAEALVNAGAELLLRIYMFPKPVLVASTGHAIALGAMLLLAADVRVGSAGAFRIGLNEVAVGMTLPMFGVMLARDRLSKRYFERAAVQAELFTPESAQDAGFLDAVVASQALEAAALAEAKRLAALDAQAFAATKRRTHRATATAIREGLAADLAEVTAALP